MMGSRAAWAVAAGFVMSLSAATATRVVAGAAPPVNGRIYFVSDGAGEFDIYSMAADGSDVRQLTDTPWDEARVDISRDGSTLVFIANPGGGSYHVYTMSVDGSNLTQLTSSAGDQLDPRWSPDGTAIAYSSTETGDADIFVMNADGSGQHDLTSSPSTDRWPAWSPDGLTLAFTSDRDGHHGREAAVFLMDAGGANPRRLTDVNMMAAMADFSPDGTKLVFIDAYCFTGGCGPSHVRTVNVDGTNLRQLTKSMDCDFGPRWSPDGRLVVFQSFSLQTLREGRLYDIRRIRSDGTGLTNLTSSPTVLEVQPSWAPA